MAVAPNILTAGPYTAANASAIFANQNTGAAGNFNINGTLATNGVATLDLPRRVLITTVGNEANSIFTLYGTNSDGISICEAITGPNASNATSVRDYKTVTRLAINATPSGNVRAGTTTVASTPWFPMNRYWTPFNVGVSVVVSGTVNYTVEYTDANLFDLSVVQTTTSIPVFSHPVLASQTANASDNFAFPVGAVRLTLNSWSGSGTASMYLRQQRN